MKSTRNLNTCNPNQFFSFRLDPERIKQVGPDKSCAEWLLKCGATVRFHGRTKSINDYNQLGMAVRSGAKLAEVYAEEATIMSNGFLHFSRCHSSCISIACVSVPYISIQSFILNSTDNTDGHSSVGLREVLLFVCKGYAVMRSREVSPECYPKGRILKCL